MSTPKTSAFGANVRREESTVTLPSGRKITVIEMTGDQEDIFKGLGNKAKTYEVINKFLMDSTKALDGKDTPTTEKDFEDMLSGDRTACLIHIRTLTHGTKVTYVVHCTECKSDSECVVDIQPIFDEAKPYPHGNEREFSVKLPEGEIFFELPTGKTERRMKENGRSDANAALAAMHLWEVTKDGKLPVQLSNLKARQTAELRKAVSALLCKMDTTVKIACQKCGAEYQEGLVTNPNFFYPNLATI